MSCTSGFIKLINKKLHGSSVARLNTPSNNFFASCRFLVSATLEFLIHAALNSSTIVSISFYFLNLKMNNDDY